MTKELVITENLTNKICQELMLGVPLARLARSKEYPSLTRIYKQIMKDKGFANKITEARKFGAQTYIEKAMDELETADNRNIMVVREKVQLAKLIATKLIPDYEDKQDIKQDTNITIQWNNPDDKVVDVTPDVDAVEVGTTQLKQS